MMGIFPVEFRRHFRGMVREGLLAIRSLVDAGIEGLEKPSRKEEAKPPTEGAEALPTAENV
ncbi:MAG TPA: hypothetical protein VJ256_02075 [Dehalococcoidia bacterium]|nr:hypothetical protein [Dehalococcoidia bacterium]